MLQRPVRHCRRRVCLPAARQCATAIAGLRGFKPAFDATDIDTDTDSPKVYILHTRWHARFPEVIPVKLNGEVARHADILATILARMSARMSVLMSVSWNAGFTAPFLSCDFSSNVSFNSQLSTSCLWYRWDTTMRHGAYQASCVDCKHCWPKSSEIQGVIVPQSR